MRASTVRRAALALACVVASAGPACDEGSPARSSPVVSLSRSPDGMAITGATAVVFTATVTDTSGEALTVSWDLGDGQKATGASVVHVYATEGVFPVAVTATAQGAGTTTVGSSITVGGLSGRWLLSEGGERFYEAGFDIAQAGLDLGGRPFSVPDKGCIGDLHGRVVSPRTVRFEFQACDGNPVVVEGTVAGDLRSVSGTYTHPDGPPQAVILTRE